MANFYVREQGAVVRKRDERLLVTKKDEVIDEILMHQLDQLIIVGNIQLTTQAVAMLLYAKVDVVYMSIYGRFRGRLMPDSSKYAELRVRQLKHMSDEVAALAIARQMVMGKLTHQRGLLESLSGKTMGAGNASIGRIMAMGSRLDQAIYGIAEMANRSISAGAADSLLGFEGKAGAYYWQGFRELLKRDLGFTQRAYRPSPDPVNALLSFGYSLLQKDMSTAVKLVGLDEYLGFFHVIHYGRPSLTLDLMEEFRPLIVDKVVLDLVNSDRIQASDFRSGAVEIEADAMAPEEPDTGTGLQALTGPGSGVVANNDDDTPRPTTKRHAIFLNSDALQRVVAAYERRATSEVVHPPTGDKTSLRRCMELQARQLARVVKGEEAKFIPMMMGAAV